MHISIILMGYILTEYSSTIIVVQSLTVTVNIFEVVFHAWMASIMFLCKNGLLSWENYNAERKNEQNHYAVAIEKRTAECTEKVVGHGPISSMYI